MAKIKQIHAREILDSRGNPTVEVDICLVGGILTEQVPVSDVPEYEQLNPLPIYSALL